MSNSEPPPDSLFSLPVLLLCAGTLLTLSMLFSISESAFLSLNKLRLRVRLKKNNKKAKRVSHLLKHRDFLINTLLIANDLVNVMLSSILTVTLVKTFGENGIVITTGITTILLLVFGEITPKAISTRKADQIAYGLSGFVNAVVIVLKPATAVFTSISRFILKLMGVEEKKDSASFTEEDIKTFLDVGAESGILEKDEKNLMQRVFKFTDLEAQDIMIPRTKIITINNKYSLADILELSKRTQYSRFPVCAEGVDDIIGIVYVKDLLFCNEEDFEVSKIMRPPLFILGTKKMSSIQQTLRENHQAMAVVVDEYSGTDGILTTADISRELFGPTMYGIEANEDTEKKSLPTINTDDFIASGSSRLIDLKETLRIPLDSKINETLGGWIMEQLDYIPGVSESVEFCGYRFVVEKMNQNYIDSVHIKIIKGEKSL